MNKETRSPLLHKVLSKGSYLKILKGESLNSSDEKQNVILVDKGYFKRFLISNEGKLGIQIIYGPDDVFPLTQIYDSLLNQEIYTGQEVFYYEAMCDGYVYSMNANDFAEESQKNPLLFRDLFSEAGHHLAVTIQRIENIAIANSSYKRLAHQLLFFANKFGIQTSQGVCIQLPLTHQDLADILSVNRETITRGMVKLRKKKLIETGQLITVLGTDRLSIEAYN